MVGPAGGRSAVRLERGVKRRGPHPALLVGGYADDLVRSKSEQPQCAEHRHVNLVADNHAHSWRVLKAVGFDVPARASQQLVTRCCEGGEIGHVAAGDEPDAGVGRKTEEIDQPSGGDFFDHGRRRRHHEQRRRLIPHRCQPFGGDRCRQRATGDEPEVSRPGRRDQSGLSGAGERIDHLGGIDRIGGQRDTERSAKLLKRRRRSDWTGGARCCVRARNC